MTRILTTHVGSLPRSQELLDANAQHAAGTMDDEQFHTVLEREVDAVMRRQRSLGLKLINDGEYGHIMREQINFGSWWWYSFTRLGGLTLHPSAEARAFHTKSATRVTLATFEERRDWQRFKAAYADPNSGIHIGNPAAEVVPEPVIEGPITYIGADQVEQDITNVLRGLKEQGLDPSCGFIASVAPGSAARIANAYYETDTDVVMACADALHEEYKAITDAGLTVQIDDPSLAESWDQINPAPSIEDYRTYIQVRVDAINRALEGIPPEQVRLHVCWGSWHGPHTTDLPFQAIVDKVLQVNAGIYSFEAAGARHEHEYRIWDDVELPDGKRIAPGVVAHSTNVVEHPELVAQRIERFARRVGAENVIASTDCGLGGRVHPDIAWAKLDALVQGARIASERL
ncbi:cobalamin-independent methionine synthase II family protein [Neoactinobaculum massilliense]|uniref:cobalamin-independent methionine synthase II family protein n=1 Tax=Neoactinobaculum massilliense TaxID=2364794 RepID=UPI000F530C99|nr:cobalamin-independent methionine synthase II family protein [Neoactinobaculum massilliense]